MSKENDNNDINIDSAQESAFNIFYKSLPEKLASTIRFFDRTDYWTVHGSDASFIANEIIKTPSAVKQISTGKYVVVRQTLFDDVMRQLLLVRLYRVEVYNKNNNTWGLAYKASPGNLCQFEDLLYSSDVTSSSGLMAVKKTNEAIGICFIDMSNYKVVVCEERGDGFEGILLQLRPVECLVEGGGVGGFREILEKNHIALTECKKSDFDTKNIKQDMERLLRKGCVPATDSKLVLSSFAACIKYLELLSDDSNFQQLDMTSYTSSCHMRVNTSTFKSLNILPSANLAATTLFSTMNHCRTKGGQRLLSSWLYRPLTDVNIIEDRLTIVEALYNLTELRAKLHDDLLRRTFDPVVTCRRLRNKKATLFDCVKLYKLVKLIPYFVEVMEGGMEEMDQGVKEKFDQLFVSSLKDSQTDLQRYAEMVEQTVDLDKCDNADECFIRPDFDDALGVLQEQIDEIEGKFKKELNKAARDLGLESNKNIKLDSSGQQGWHLRITRKDEKCLRGNERHYKVIDANKGGVKFRSCNMEDLNDRYLSIKEEFVKQQRSVVAEVINVAVGYLQPIETLLDLVNLIDVFVSLATSCAAAPKQFVRPIIVKDGPRKLHLKGVRHACLERKDDLTYIPNDVTLSQNDKNMYIITGPNMGGKSTYIRSIGLVVILAQIGCMVPCDEVVLSPFDALYARVGAGDDQINGVSTFMAEMLETSSILKSSTDRSLVLVDELGRGTSTYDGFGLAHAIAKHLATEIKCMTLFASHFHELTSLADEVKSVTNVHATAAVDGSTLTLLYKIEEGICDQSFGIHVAEMIKFPTTVLKKAKRLADSMEQSTSIIIGKGGHDDDPVHKKRKLSLEEVRSFIRKVQTSSDFWRQIQTLKTQYGII